MKRVLLLMIAIAIVGSGCATTLGRTMPECDSGSATMVLAVQSVPYAEYVSCINGLKAGWDYEDLEARSGRSVYLLDSDRLGHGFLRVENVESCEVGESVLEATDDRGIEWWKDIDSEVESRITIVPEGPTPETSARAVDLIIEMQGRELEGRPIVLTPAVDGGTTKERIEAAAASGAHVIAIGIRDVEEGTLTVLPKGATTEVVADSIDDALDLLEEAETEAFYTGTWTYVFEGGCVVYTFDAEGQGVSSIEDDVQLALSLFDAAAFRQLGRDAGYRIP